MIGGGPAAAAGKHVITPDQLRSIAFWSHDLNEKEFERARRGIVERAFPKGAYICHRGDRLESWTGVASGLIKLQQAELTAVVARQAGRGEKGYVEIGYVGSAAFSGILSKTIFAYRKTNPNVELRPRSHGQSPSKADCQRVVISVQRY